MSNAISRSSSPIQDLSAPEAAASEPCRRAGSSSRPPVPPTPPEVSPEPTPAERAIKGREKALRFIQQLTDIALKADHSEEAAHAVPPATLARMRALVLLGPITVAANEIPDEPIVERTGFEEFDREQAIAARNANEMNPYCIEALDRLMMLDDPPTTWEECDNLLEHLELYHEAPDPYGIPGPGGDPANLQLQAYRAYAQVLSRGLPMEFPPRVPVRIVLDLGALGLEREPIECLAEGAGIPRLEDLRELAPALLSRGFLIDGLACVAIGTHGRLALEKMIELADGLLRHGFSIDHIIDAGCNDDGHLVLERAHQWMPDLLGLGFSPQDITHIASSSKEEPILAQTVESASRLDTLGFKPADIARIAAHPTGHLNLEKTVELAQALFDLGYTVRDIVRIGGQRNGHLNLEKTAELTPTLIRQGLSLHRIAAWADRNDGYAVLQQKASAGSS